MHSFKVGFRKMAKSMSASSEEDMEAHHHGRHESSPLRRHSTHSDDDREHGQQRRHSFVHSYQEVQIHPDRKSNFHAPFSHPRKGSIDSSSSESGGEGDHKRVLSIKDALREIVETNSKITVMKKQMAVPTENEVEKEKMQQVFGTQISELLLTVTNVYIIDKDDRNTFTGLKERVLAELVHMQDSLLA
eukprot:2347625-Rhodomonas_salina.1